MKYLFKNLNNTFYAMNENNNINQDLKYQALSGTVILRNHYCLQEKLNFMKQNLKHLLLLQTKFLFL